MTSLQKWLRTIAWLRRKFPAQRKVYVRTRKMKYHYGIVVFRDNKFHIQIGKEPLAIKQRTLIHEWAHILTWFGSEREEEHSDEWGLCYAKIYRAFEKIEL